MDGIIEDISNKIIKLCEEHKIRLTPKEYSQLTIDYLNHFIYNISVTDLIELSENIKRRN